MSVLIALLLSTLALADVPPGPPPAPAPAPTAVARPWIGVQITAGARGVRIDGVNAETPAAAAGLRAGDEILTIDGIPVQQPDALRAAVAARGVGQRVALVVLRDGQELPISLELAARPDDREMLRRMLVDKPAPAWQLAGMSGPYPADLAALRGHVVVAEFWATWCGPCRTTMPTLAGWHERHAADGLRVVGIAAQTEAEIKPHLARYPVPYAIAWDDGGATSRAYRAQSIPLVVVIDREGIVRYAGLGSGSNVTAAGQVAAKLLGLASLD